MRLINLDLAFSRNNTRVNWLPILVTFVFVTILFSSNVISQDLMELEQRVTELENKTSPITLVHPGSMCTSVNETVDNDQCLELGPNGAKNICDKKIIISCPLVIEPHLDTSPRYKTVSISVYGPETPRVRARIIWHNSYSWEWGKCTWTEAQKLIGDIGLSISVPFCTSTDSYAYALEVELPSFNSWVYYYVPIPINTGRYD